MPKYLSSNAVSIRSYNLEASVPLVVEEFIQNLPAGVTVDNTVGCYDPIISSNKVTSTSTVTIPATNTPYVVSVFCTTGEVAYKVNSVGNTCTIGPNMEMAYKCQTRVINTLAFTITSGTAYVTVTKA